MSESALLSVFENLRTALPNASITAFTHIKHVGISKVIDPRGRITSYHYDGLGRLEKILNHEGNILEQYQYHYAGPSE